MTTVVKEKVHKQIVEKLQCTSFPIKTQKDLLAVFSGCNGPSCKTGDCTIPAEKIGYLLKESDYPLKNAKEVADIIVKRACL